MNWETIFTTLIGATFGLSANLIILKLNHKRENNKSKENFYKYFKVYENHLDLIQTRIYEHFILYKESSSTEIELERISRTSVYLKDELIKFPIEIIPKEIFMEHRIIIDSLIHFHLSTEMEKSFQDSVHPRKNKGHQENYDNFKTAKDKIEQFLDIYKQNN